MEYKERKKWEKKFYQENYPEIAIEKAGIDQIITLIISGTREGM